MPADAEEAISVGATYLEAWQHAAYSSIGPDKLPYIKPDVAAFSLLGTSFSAPVITGAVACLMERFPNRKPREYADALRASGHLHAVPNTYLGHGVPSLPRAAQALDGTLQQTEPERLSARGQILVSLPNEEAVVVFHKKDIRNVLEQQVLHTPKAGPTTVVRPQGAAYTTLATQQKVWEIEWKD
jgi:subtilisin family serine protease